jgi:hypothetical protein
MIKKKYTVTKSSSIKKIKKKVHCQTRESWQHELSRQTRNPRH